MLRPVVIAFCCVVSAPSPAAASDVLLEGRAGRISAAGWTIEGLESELLVTESGLDAMVRVERIALLESGQSFDDIRIGCTGLAVTNHGVTCGDAVFDVLVPGLGRRQMPGTFAWNKPAGTVQVSLRDVALAGGEARVELLAGDAGFEASFSGSGLDLGGLLELAGNLSADLAALIAGFTADGQAAIDGSLSLPAGGVLQASVTVDLDHATLGNDAGTVAAAGLTGRLNAGITMVPGSIEVDLELDAASGEAYVEPVYGNFSEHALRLRATGVRTADFSIVEIDRFEIGQETLFDASGTAMLEFPSGDESPSITADVTLGDSSIESLYSGFVQLQFAGTMLGVLDTAGRVSGTIRVADSALRFADLQLRDAIFDDSLGRFAIYGLSGDVRWNADGSVPPASRLSWDSGTVYSLIVGGGALEMQLGDNDIELLEPARLPLLGGALTINELALYDFGTFGATGRLDAELEPVQLGQITGAFGWPAFSGRLSGRLPLLTLSNDTVTIGGTLSAQLFDGSMTMSNLRILQPFGRVPRLYADIAVRDLDLQRVTEAFSFGYIQGRLSGDVTGLILENWRPTAMDLNVYTPADDRSQHRISQRAVENLASVGGGGAGAVLSTGFLKFFEVFAYDRIGLRCRLENGVCTMSGVEPAGRGALGTGYYIVKGSGLPRIDVVGYRDTVSWPRLVQQLSAITRNSAPTVR